MKKVSKKPRKFGRRKVKKKSIKKLEREIKSLSNETLALMNEIQPGFTAWYRDSYDDKGTFVGERMPGLFG